MYYIIGGLPGWGLTGLTGVRAKCCGAGDPIVGKKWLADQAKKQPHKTGSLFTLSVLV